MDAWVVEALRVGYRIPFDRRPPLSERPLSLPAYSPQSIKGVALTQELQTLLRKGAVEPAPQSPGFYSRLFLVQKASGSWRPIIDLSTLNDYVTSSQFHMETPQSVLRSIRLGDWMVSLDLQDAYLQVPVHHDSRRYLRFVVGGRSFQFRVLCFGLTTASQVFTRIMAPVSAILHKYGVRMLSYLDDWLILASSEIACLQSRDRLLTICTELGIQVNLTKSSLVPTQSLVYLGMEIRSLPFIARPTPVRVSNLLHLIEEFLSTPSPPASLWRRLRGHLLSLTLLVSGGMLRMRLLQLCLKDQWDFLDDQFQVSWSPLCREDLLWWARVAQLREGVSLSLPAPDVSFFSDASYVGWGALVGEHHASGLWSPHQKTFSINLRELLAVQYGLKALEHLLVGLSVALFCDNTTTVAYLRRSGGTFSSTLNATAREILLWAENHRVLNDPTRSWGSPPHEVIPADSSASVGSDRSVSAGRVVTGNSRRSFLVARPRSLSARRFSGAGVPSAQVLVRRLGRGLGGSLGRAGRFRPVGSGRRRALDQCTGARSMHERALKWFAPLLAGASVAVFADNSTAVSYLRNQGGTQFFFSELHRSEDSPLGGGSVGSAFPTVCYGETQCAGGRSFSPKPDLGLRVDAEAGGLQGSVQEVAGVNRPVCNISKSQMFHIFFSLPRSQCSGDGCASSKLE